MLDGDLEKIDTPAWWCAVHTDMNSWENTLDKFYESIDPKYEKDEEEMDMIMSRCITDRLELAPNLMFDHEFVKAAAGWLAQGRARTMFKKYEDKIIADLEFAKAAIRVDPSLMRTFALASSAHYDSICRLAVSLSWRSLLHVDSSKCEDMSELSRISLRKAYADADAKPGIRRFVVKYVLRRLLAVAAEAGLAPEEIEAERARFGALELRVSKRGRHTPIHAPLS